mmetsp:Transcript_34399/g.40204  ORF Transcript_34399/g.40204 Transcript_34399/m.40204 type:complete len:209 (+) Transcript_34399:238-864(+)
MRGGVVLRLNEQEPLHPLLTAIMDHNTRSHHVRERRTISVQRHHKVLRGTGEAIGLDDGGKFFNCVFHRFSLVGQRHAPHGQRRCTFFIAPRSADVPAQRLQVRKASGGGSLRLLLHAGAPAVHRLHQPAHVVRQRLLEPVAAPQHWLPPEQPEVQCHHRRRDLEPVRGASFDAKIVDSLLRVKLTLFRIAHSLPLLFTILVHLFEFR